MTGQLPFRVRWGSDGLSLLATLDPIINNKTGHLPLRELRDPAGPENCDVDALCLTTEAEGMRRRNETPDFAHTAENLSCHYEEPACYRS